jgi:hypothetical protein
MSTVIKNTALVAACEAMLTESISYDEMDCQDAVEEALIRCGVPAKTCNLAGSNAHYRRTLWRGTPERCCALLGVQTVPAGFQMYIVLSDGNEPAKYQADSMGNADHMGWYLGNGRTFNSSESNGGVCVSAKFNGRKAVANGGWNMVGWSEWVDCGLTEAQIAALKDDANYSGAVEDTDTPAAVDTTEETTETVSPAFSTKYSRYRWRSGDKGSGVKAVQTALNRAGADPQLNVDGDFGPTTKAAVVAFQIVHGLEADGVVGEYTWDALIKAVNVA